MLETPAGKKNFTSRPPGGRAGGATPPPREVVEGWSVEEVEKYVVKVGMEDCVDIVRRKHLDGKTLLGTNDAILQQWSREIRIIQLKKLSKLVNNLCSADNASDPVSVAKTVSQKKPDIVPKPAAQLNRRNTNRNSNTNSIRSNTRSSSSNNSNTNSSSNNTRSSSSNNSNTNSSNNKTNIKSSKALAANSISNSIKSRQNSSSSISSNSSKQSTSSITKQNSSKPNNCGSSSSSKQGINSNMSKPSTSKANIGLKPSISSSSWKTSTTSSSISSSKLSITSTTSKPNFSSTNRQNVSSSSKPNINNRKPSSSSINQASSSKQDEKTEQNWTSESIKTSTFLKTKKTEANILAVTPQTKTSFTSTTSKTISSSATSVMQSRANSRSKNENTRIFNSVNETDSKPANSKQMNNNLFKTNGEVPAWKKVNAPGSLAKPDSSHRESLVGQSPGEQNGVSPREPEKQAVQDTAPPIHDLSNGQQGLAKERQRINLAIQKFETRRESAVSSVDGDSDTGDENHAKQAGSRSNSSAGPAKSGLIPDDLRGRMEERKKSGKSWTSSTTGEEREIGGKLHSRAESLAAGEGQNSECMGTVNSQFFSTKSIKIEAITVVDNMHAADVDSGNATDVDSLNAAIVDSGNAAIVDSVNAAIVDSVKAAEDVQTGCYEELDSGAEWPKRAEALQLYTAVVKTGGIKTSSRQGLATALRDAAQKVAGTGTIGQQAATEVNSEADSDYEPVSIPELNCVGVDSSQSRIGIQYSTVSPVNAVQKVWPQVLSSPRSSKKLNDIGSHVQQRQLPATPLPAPSPPRPPSPPQTSELDPFPWYQNIDRKSSEQVVKQLNCNGAFVIRRSKHGGKDSPFTLTVFNVGKVYNINIRKRGDGAIALGKQKNDEMTYSSVASMVEFHMKEPLKLTSSNVQSPSHSSTALSAYPPKIANRRY